MNYSRRIVNRVQGCARVTAEKAREVENGRARPNAQVE